MVTKLLKIFENMKSVAVIGAGCAGLCMARYLAAENQLFKVVVFEQGSKVGGTWIYDDVSISPTHGIEGIREMENNTAHHSSMYKSLRTNLPKQVMEYPDFQYPKNLKTFPTHGQVLDYLQDYCTHFNLESSIRFNETVTHVAPQPQENITDHLNNVKWTVKTSNVKSGIEESAVFDSVVVCNGHFSTPNIPDIPGIENYKGSVLHSHFYRVPDAYSNKEVVVLGAKSSGRDIAIEISKVAKNVFLSHRSKRVACPLPDNVNERFSIKSISNKGRVIFQDDSEADADAIVFCTGYKFNLPFLDKSCGVNIENQRIFPLYHQIFNAKYPSMSFIGLQNIICPSQLFSMQARWVVNVLAGRVSLPTVQEMEDCAEDELQKKKSLGISERYFHQFEKDLQWDYYNTICEKGKVEPIKPIVEKLYKQARVHRDRDLLNYRNSEYIVVNEDDYEVIPKLDF